MSFWLRKKAFLRAQIAAFAAGVVDWGVLLLSVEILHVYYPVGVAFGAFLGAVTNFYLNRHWSFEVGHHPVSRQAWRYAGVSTGSLVLNTYGVYFVTEFLGPNYIFSKVIVSIAVAIFYNYPLHRYFVYQGENHA